MVSATHSLDSLEGRVQQLGRALLGQARAYRPTPSERFQDWVMLLATREPTFRNSLLRFVDVLAALDFDSKGSHLKRLAREYFARPLPRLPPALKLTLALAPHLLPAPLVAYLARGFTSLIARRFVAAPGRGFSGALAYLERHHRYGSFDILGETVWSEEEADGYAQRYLRLIADLAARPGARQRTAGGKPRFEVSLKLSALAAHFTPADPAGTYRRIRERLEWIMSAARAAEIAVNIDLEQYEYRDLTWYLLEREAGRGGLFGSWDSVGIVIQGYLRDSLPFVERARRLAQDRGAPLHIRLVRGAYWDYEVVTAGYYHWPIPVFTQKSHTDRAYEELVVEVLCASPDLRLAIGSHNLRSHAFAESAREALGLA